MSQSHLASCPSCARHVRVSEAACPFCRASLSEAFRATPARQAPRARLGRAALFALGTGAVAVTPGCSSSSTPGVQPLYGGVTVEDASVDAAAADTGSTGSDAAADAEGTDGGPSAQPLYGAVATGDDAGSDSGHVAEPAYGAIPLYGIAPGGH
jgi:hypothetical protein